MHDMTGQVVAITGASRGIGAAAAEVFAQAGAKVALIARSGGEIKALAEKIGPSAMAVSCDVSSYAALAAGVAQITEELGPVTTLINNAGVIAPIARLSEADPVEWARAIDINLTGVFNGMRAVLPAMKAAGQGTIITVSSGAAHSPIEAWSHYCSSKAGAAMLTRCAHSENAEWGARIMGLSPGTVATQMQRDIKASGINPVSALDWDVHVPADWPARTLLWMCSPEADRWCGEEISLRDEDIRMRVGLV